MLFVYKVIDNKGSSQQGQIEAVSRDVAIQSLQRRGLIVVNVEKKDERGAIKRAIPFFDKVPLKDVVIVSRQLSTLFEAQVSAVSAFDLMAESSSSATLHDALQGISQDIQGGLTISQSMQKYPEVFSDFYVNMVAAGEEAGKLTETFIYLADYLERQYELTSKTRNALVYPAFVVFTFFVVMGLMLTMVIPKLSVIIRESGQDIPFYTKIVMGLSDFFVNYGWILLVALVIAGAMLYFSTRKAAGRERIDALKLSIPHIGNLYQKLYLSRISDNIHTMLSAGIPVVRTLEITSSIVNNKIYEKILLQSIEGVKAGNPISRTFAQHPEMPPILVQMVKVGEETGQLATILETVSRFYKREVNSAVDTLIGMIEPVMIILLGIGVGFLLTSVLLPIYNLTGSIG